MSTPRLPAAGSSRPLVRRPPIRRSHKLPEPTSHGWLWLVLAVLAGGTFFFVKLRENQARAHAAAAAAEAQQAARAEEAQQAAEALRRERDAQQKYAADATARAAAEAAARLAASGAAPTPAEAPMTEEATAPPDHGPHAGQNHPRPHRPAGDPRP